MWLSLVSARLQILTISVWTSTPLTDLSLLERLTHLTVIPLPTEVPRSASTRIIPLRNLSPAMATFELNVGGGFDPWSTAAYVAEVLQAFDYGFIPSLSRVIISVCLSEIKHFGKWISAAFLLVRVVERRGLEFRLDMRFKLYHSEACKVDLFCKARYEWENKQNIQGVEGEEVSGPPGRGGEDPRPQLGVWDRIIGLLTTAAHT